jgi:CheY-like chemotaxis protein
MPNMDGYQAIELIMAYQPTPILVVTGANVRDGRDITFKVLELGALDLMEKPTHAWGDELRAKEIELLEKINLLSKVKVIRHVKGKVKEKKPIDNQLVYLFLRHPKYLLQDIGTNPVRMACGSVVGSPALLDAASTMISFSSSCNFSKFHPKRDASWRSSFGRSSRVTNTPLSPYFEAPE